MFLLVFWLVCTFVLCFLFFSLIWVFKKKSDLESLQCSCHTTLNGNRSNKHTGCTQEQFWCSGEGEMFNLQNFCFVSLNDGDTSKSSLSDEAGINCTATCTVTWTLIEPNSTREIVSTAEHGEWRELENGSALLETNIAPGEFLSPLPLLPSKD